jgi:Fur family transcriptional regulator, ferric uptake regulator
MAKTRRNSRQREVVLEELRNMKTHPTAAELHDVVRERLPRISLGTVYRNLELLAGDGLVRKLEYRGGRARFDGDLEQHLHVVCIACGSVGDVSGQPADVGLDDLATPDGYRIFGMRVELTGLCPDCARRVPEEKIELLRKNLQNNN